MSNPSAIQTDDRSRDLAEQREWNGLVFIGDPHLSSRVPGFRADDYPRTALRKLEWCLNYADQKSLVPILLGDLFDRPRDNANWLVGEILRLLAGRTVLAIYGNHDCRENQLTDDDTFSIILKSGLLTLLTPDQPWAGTVNGRNVIVGGSPWGQELPERWTPPAVTKAPFVVWTTHHDISLGDVGKTDEVQGNRSPEASTEVINAEPQELKPQALFVDDDLPKAKSRKQRVARGLTPNERPGIDVIVNGHIHKRFDPITVGGTSWILPGNLVRLDRSEKSRQQPPSIMTLKVLDSGWETSFVEVPHERYDDVFLEASVAEPVDDLESAFVKGLAELQARRTESGAGLVYFLQHNLNQFDQDVAQEVVRLAEKVTTQTIDFDWSSFADTDPESEPELTGLLANLKDDSVSSQSDATESTASEGHLASELATATATDEEFEDDDEERPRQRMLF